MSKKSEGPITLVVRRGAFRRFHKLQKETANLPVVVTWDRRGGDGGPAVPSASDSPVEDRRRQPAFTWDLADFVVVPGTAETDELQEEAHSQDDEAPEAKKSRQR